MPTTREVCDDTTGWCTMNNSPAASARSSSAVSATRSRASRRMSSVYNSQRPRPLLFARYIAVSALRSNVTAASEGASSASSAGVDRAMPMLAEVTISMPCKTTWPVTAWRTRSATSIATCSSERPSQMTTNSSPLMRATRSVGRVADAMRLAIVVISWSPTEWPTESLTCFNLSRSMNSSPTPRLVVTLRSRASDNLRKANTRLGSPVSASWVACRDNSSCICLASVTSRAIAE